ncbi:MAG: nucleotide-binding protein, partial [Haliea sp.]
PKPAVAPNNVFLVHGHDHGSLETVARFLEKLGLDVTILHEKPNRGQTIIEKLERESDVDLAVVLLTPDDVGSTVDDQENLSPRARQNVVMELGLFIGKLGRDRTFALVKGAIEKPSDYHGVLYIPFGPKYPWKVALAKELKEAGANIDLNDAL